MSFPDCTMCGQESDNSERDSLGDVYCSSCYAINDGGPYAPVDSEEDDMQKHLTQQHIKRHPEKLQRFKQVRIWSNEWFMWWRANGAGYTRDINDAGIYEANDAWKYVSHCGPEKKIVLQAV